MADNLAVTPGTGVNIASDEATYSGDTTKIQIVRLVHVAGAEGSKTVSELIRAEDSAHTSGDPGMMFLAVRNDTPGTLAGTDLDYAPLQLDSAGNLRNSLATLLAGEDLTNNVLKTEQRLSYTNLSADTAVKSGAGRFFGFVVNSHSSGTLKVWDNTAGSGSVLLNTLTFAAGSGIVVTLPGGVDFATGLYADIGGTIDLTIFYK